MYTYIIPHSQWNCLRAQVITRPYRKQNALCLATLVSEKRASLLVLHKEDLINTPDQPQALSLTTR